MLAKIDKRANALFSTSFYGSVCCVMFFPRSVRFAAVLCFYQIVILMTEIKDNGNVLLLNFFRQTSLQ